MSIWLPNKNKSPTEYGLPINIVDPKGMTPDDDDLLRVMGEHQPKTKLKEGDLVYLTECPPALRMRMKDRMIPLVWKVRFIVSSWTFELHQLAHSFPDRILGLDHAIHMIDSHSTLAPNRYTRPVIYAHAMPHGKWPDTAYWFREYRMEPNRYGEMQRNTLLKKVAVRDPNVEWSQVLDEAQAPFMGYDLDEINRPYVLDMAPDLYGDGENLGRPLPHEEAAIHTACLLGMESLLLGELSDGVDPYYLGGPGLVDPEHDIFRGK